MVTLYITFGGRPLDGQTRRAGCQATCGVPRSAPVIWTGLCGLRRQGAPLKTAPISGRQALCFSNFDAPSRPDGCYPVACQLQLENLPLL